MSRLSGRVSNNSNKNHGEIESQWHITTYFILNYRNLKKCS